MAPDNLNITNLHTTKAKLTRRTASRDSRAFTLIELLVVIGILSVLASLITGVTVYVMDKANREQTLTNQLVIINAVDRYYEIMGEYPPDGSDAASLAKLAVLDNPPVAADSGAILLRFLTTGSIDTAAIDAGTINTPFARRLRPRVAKIQKSSAAVLLELPEGAMDPGGFMDAYGNYMTYDMDGGLGGTPVVISAGPDTTFNTEDDIRSDSR